MYNRKAISDDYKDIINIREKSVTATQSFLSFNDKQDIKREISLYLPQLDVQLQYVDSSLIGFSAVNKNHLEMLFLKSNKTGKGYGKQILQALIDVYNVITVDVNKDNLNAKSFYLKNGFSIISEDPTDDAGRPYPIIHLELQ